MNLKQAVCLNKGWLLKPEEVPRIEEYLQSMSRFEFLKMISDGIERMKEQS